MFYNLCDGRGRWSHVYRVRQKSFPGALRMYHRSVCFSSVRRNISPLLSRNLGERNSFDILCIWYQSQVWCSFANFGQVSSWKLHNITECERNCVNFGHEKSNTLFRIWGDRGDHHVVWSPRGSIRFGRLLSPFSPPRSNQTPNAWKKMGSKTEGGERKSPCS